MLSDTLNTNEIKNAAGTGVAFERVSSGPGKATIFQKSGAYPGNPQTLTIKHGRVGTGIQERRESVIIFDVLSEDENDATKFHTSAQLKIVHPVGRAGDNSDLQTVLAYMMSFLASLGASTTILYDGTGNGAKTLLNETL